MSDWETEERRPRPISHRTQVTQVDSRDTWTRSSAWPQRSAMRVDRQQHEARHRPWLQSHSPPIQARSSATSTLKPMTTWRQNQPPTSQRVYPHVRQCWSEVDSQPTPSRQDSRRQTTTPWPSREPRVCPATWRHRASLDDSPDVYHTGAFDEVSWPRRHPSTYRVETRWASQLPLDVDSTPTQVLQPAARVDDTLGGDRIEQQPFSSVGRERQRHWSDCSSRRLSYVSENEAADKHMRQVRPRVGRSWLVKEVAPTHQPRIASRRRGNWLRNDVQQVSSSSSSTPVRVHKQVQDSFVARESRLALASLRDGSASRIHRNNESDKAQQAAGIKVEDQDAQVQLQAVKQRSSALLGKRKVRAGSRSRVDETIVGVKRSCDVVHNNKKNNIVGQRNGNAVSRTVKPKRYRKPCEIDGCKSIATSKGLCTAHGPRCQYPDGCDNGARGTTLLCITHGGGQRCLYPDGCGKGARGATSFCIAHGGGRRCQYAQGCKMSAAGATLFCLTHGGGKRCQYPDGCSTSAIGATLLCQAHGGGKRCQYTEGCSKGAEGGTMFCKGHGGGKRCQFPDGCSKSAASATLFCIAHGGGKRCQFSEGCDTSAAGATLFCVAHGGGKRCQYPDGCDKSALSGPMQRCRTHGGGKRCQYSEDCEKIAIGRTKFCVAHGGGQRCQYPDGCGNSAIGATLLCIAHGGGKRCQFPDGCGNSARGATLFCRAHGGGKRCQYPEGCDKSAEGPTVFCIAHGGGKRCQYPDGCDKSAIGATLFCQAHGGGKRCQYPGSCSKGAEGRTMFCIAHGGSKRCQYPEGCDKCARSGTSFCIAHGGRK
jgi:hypothetical protein